MCVGHSNVITLPGEAVCWGVAPMLLDSTWGCMCVRGTPCYQTLPGEGVCVGTLTFYQILPGEGVCVWGIPMSLLYQVSGVLGGCPYVIRLYLGVYVCEGHPMLSDSTR